MNVKLVTSNVLYKLNNIKKAFTLIELLIVVAIIGILASVGIQMYQGYMENAKLNTMIQNHHGLCNFIRSSQLKCEFEIYQDLPGIPYQLNCHDSIHRQNQTYALYSATLFSNPYNKSQKGCRSVGLNPVKKIGLNQLGVGGCAIGYLDSTNVASGKIIQCVTQIDEDKWMRPISDVLVDSVIWNRK